MAWAVATILLINLASWHTVLLAVPLCPVSFVLWEEECH
jgi:hypothetical protein